MSSSVQQSTSNNAPLSTNSNVPQSTSRLKLNPYSLRSSRLKLLSPGVQHCARAEVRDPVHGEVRRAVLNRQRTSLQHGERGGLQHCQRAGTSIFSSRFPSSPSFLQVCNTVNEQVCNTVQEQQCRTVQDTVNEQVVLY